MRAAELPPSTAGTPFAAKEERQDWQESKLITPAAKIRVCDDNHATKMGSSTKGLIKHVGELDNSETEKNGPTRMLQQVPSDAVPVPFSLLDDDDFSMLESLDSVSLETRMGEDFSFAAGDHVFQWCSYMGIPRAYQHHAIVVAVYQEDPLNFDALTTRLKVADFTDSDKNDPDENDSIKQTSSSLSNEEASSSAVAGISSPSRFHKEIRGCLRVYETDASKWRKVFYNASFLQCKFARSGTCTQMPSDPPRIVQARVDFLLTHPSCISFFHSVKSNCEAVALWCKTGQYLTLQAASWLGAATAAGPAKSAVAAAVSFLSSPATIAASAAGIGGEVVGTTTATTATATTLAVSQPLLLPTIAACGLVATAVPAVSLLLADRHWKKTTSSLNQAFWNTTLQDPDLFVMCLEHWSQHHESSRELKKAFRILHTLDEESNIK